MIKSEKGNVRLSGTGAELIIDFACVTKGMYHAFLDSGMPAGIAKKTVRELVDFTMEAEANKPDENTEPEQDAEPQRSDPAWGFTKLMLEALSDGRD